ncbi:omega-hydroxypalmitate O-feruloyl transferase-like [Sesamum indicum]|uniref:Omega-hydroxypalmitate O-feruloyl transferase-like n=1 Tax=Sesamum indicum TaxID=4182 RepID=A0A6I9SK49_SESIN|nr:omega-hydroxypalmitate O-feruloyl transferase-like [Sesamum indicum]
MMDLTLSLILIPPPPLYIYIYYIYTHTHTHTQKQEILNMGTLDLKPAIQDLKVAIQETTLIHPSSHGTLENKSIFLSNIDQVLNFHVQTVHFFPANPDFPPETTVARLKNALEKVMVAYDFLGGRLKFNHQTGRLEIECSQSGVGFVVATTEYSLDEVGDLVYPNPAFMQLIVQALDKFDDQPLCVLQVKNAVN